MTAPMLTSQHPSEETLAAFVDDRLDPASRPELLTHLATCGECRELVMMATDLQSAEVLGENVRQGWFGPRGWVAAVAGVAAAAVIGFFVILQPKLFGPDVHKVTAAIETLEERPSVGRLAGLPYNLAPETLRGSVETKSKGWAVLSVAGELDEARFPDAHAVGLATLGRAENGADVQKAIAALSKAYQNAESDERDAIAIDLAAALIARLRWVDSEKDARRAVDLSEQVLKHGQSPEALWNRAVALEALDEPAALRAWDDYLKFDPNSQWSQEARRRRNNLLDLP